MTKNMIENHKNVKMKEVALRNLISIENYFKSINLGYRYYNSFLAYVKRMDEIHQMDFNKHYMRYQYLDGEIIKNE